MFCDWEEVEGCGFFCGEVAAKLGLESDGGEDVGEGVAMVLLSVVEEEDTTMSSAFVSTLTFVFWA